MTNNKRISLAGPPRKLLTLELIRGLAALFIVFVHAATQIALHPQSQVKSFHGGLEFPPIPAIEVFFVVSGFAIMLAHADDFGRARRIPRFLWNRATRIYPLYWIVMADLFRRLMLPDWHTLIKAPFTALSYLSWFALLPTWDPDLLPVAWTLRFEVAFYLTFALCLLPKIGPWVMAGWLMATLWAAQVYSDHVPEPLSHVLDPFTLDFFAGMAAAFAFKRLRPSRTLAWVIVGCGLVVVALRLRIDFWGFATGPWSARLAYGLGYGCILFGLANLERAGSIVLGTWAGWLGALSYPLYLSHVAALDYGIRWFAPLDIAARYGVDAEFALLVGLCMVVSLILTLAVDRPMQKLLRWRRTEAPRQQSTNQLAPLPPAT